LCEFDYQSAYWCTEYPGVMYFGQEYIGKHQWHIQRFGITDNRYSQRVHGSTNFMKKHSSHLNSAINASITLLKSPSRMSPTQLSLDTGAWYAYSLTSPKKMDSDVTLSVTSMLK